MVVYPWKLRPVSSFNPSLPAMKGISQPRIGRPQWTVLNTMHLTGRNGWNPKRLEQCFPLRASESRISSWMVPLNNYHLDFLDSKKRWHFLSNVRSPNHSPGKSSVVIGTPFNPKNTSWHLVKCLHNQSPGTRNTRKDLWLIHLPSSPRPIFSWRNHANIPGCDLGIG